jgi:hypothetical protein
MGRREKQRLALAFAIALVCVAPVSNAGAFTIGSNLGRDPDVSLQGTDGPITVFNPQLSNTLRADPPEGLFASPVSGTLVRWRIRTGDTDTGPVSLRVIRGGPSTRLSLPRTGAGTSGTVTPALGAVSTYEANLPVQRGDVIGIDCCWPDFGQFFATPQDPLGDFAPLGIWGAPPLADGGAARAPNDTDSLALEVNADVEPTTAFTITGIKKASKHRLRVSGTFPNQGSVLAGDPRDPGLVGRPATKRRLASLLFKESYKSIAPNPGPTNVTFTVAPAPAGRERLRTRGKLSGRIKFVYAVAYGGTAVQTARFRIKQ